MKLNETQDRIKEVYDGMSELQLYKNKNYGNAGLEPLGIFFQKEHFDDDMAKAGLLCRLDDKLMRIKNSKKLRINDILDLVGYCILLLVKMGTRKTDILKFKD